MNRRKILQVTGATLATGIGANYADYGQEEGNESEGEGEGSEAPACESDIQFGERRLVIDESGFSATAYAEVVVENVGSAASGEISLTAAWLDENGNFIEDDSAYLPSLAAGETWISYVRALLTDPEEIDSFEVSGEFEVDYPRTPPGMTVVESEFDRGENLITGVAENTRDEDIERVEAQAKLYDEDGAVLGGSSTWERDHPAGRDWSFEIGTPRLPASVEPEEHVVMLDASTFQIRG